MTDNKDDRIVDFNELKNKAREKDIDNFEQYIYDLYYSLSQGELSIVAFSSKIKEYMDKNSISSEKLFNIQKEMMKRYGLDPEDIEAQMKSLGLNFSETPIESDYENIRKAIGFNEKYKNSLNSKVVSTYSICNNSNNLDIILDKENVILRSSNVINLKDLELNDFLCSYKKVLEDKPLNISLCENIKTYEY
ncbi:DUF3867 domain-containing protein [Clostridium algidicarnis]|uniref:DUF3867 domain-containing protein n=1 Tax=Clostridium algidicarnis TaxID=37659 RepID=UPI001C0AE18B|nr:DUF3867 domain-containing protein [Clostridium algidicarnis]MBU3209939.1 DUF3867 domain-containing protein [Clostridium algidicarnis]MBU3228478.1 DUF3867 domain-containing protein [Clostridium algidicarnis]MBU3252221.1 DUF3867 domain-containing protein [Clostridium algidicarnis]